MLISFTPENQGSPPWFPVTSPVLGNACSTRPQLSTSPGTSHLSLPYRPSQVPVPLSGLKESFYRCPQLLLSLWERCLAGYSEKHKTGVAAREGWPAGPRDRDTLSSATRAASFPDTSLQHSPRPTPEPALDKLPCWLLARTQLLYLHHYSEPGRIPRDPVCAMEPALE